VNETFHTHLAAAIERYLEILADHGFILEAECDSFILEPVHGVYAILFYAMQTIDPDFPRVERLQSTLGPDEDLDRLEDQLVGFTAVLEALCADYQASTGIDPIQEPDDPTGGRVAMALVGADIAIERLRAEAAAGGERPAETALSALAELRAEDDASAMNRHLALRLDARR
jgi:hypothetical protein